MRMKQCRNGHFYDEAKDAVCPYCTPEANAHAAAPRGGTVPLDPSLASAGSRTVAMIKQEIGIDPVVGWLVCVEGTDRGRDYRLHSDNNFIGRDARMDVCIRNDETVSRVNHAILSYDGRSGEYYLSVGEGRSILRHNGQALFGTVTLAAMDRIEIGNTKLMFIPLCGEGFSWT